MKIQSISSQNYSLKQSKPAFRAIEVVENDDLNKLIDFAAKKPETAKDLMVALKMLQMKKQDSRIQYTATPDGEIKLSNLGTGRSVIKINDYNHTAMGANLRSFMRFAAPADEQHQRLLGSGMSRPESEELKDIAALAVYEEMQKSPIYKEIKALEAQKLEKTKELIRSMVVTA